jgi:hypothetical protein
MDHDRQDDDRRDYEAPELSVLASVEEATLMGTEGDTPDGSLSSFTPSQTQ